MVLLMSLDTQAVDRFSSWIEGDERRRLAVVFGVSIGFLLLLLGTFGSNLGLFPFGLAAVLVAYLYTRKSGQTTVTASATGPGVLCIGLYVFQVSRTIAGASTEPIGTTVIRHAGWLSIGLLLVVLGAGLYRTGR